MARQASLVAVVGLVAVSCGSPSTSTSSDPIATAVETTVAVTTTLAPTTSAASTTIAAATTTTAVAPNAGRPTSIWAVPDGIEVAVAGFDGLHLLAGTDDKIIDPGVFEDVAADPTGDGWFAEEPAAIHHITDDGSNEVVVSAEEGTWLQLHDVGLVEGHVTVVYNVNRQHDGANDGNDDVMATDLVTGITTKIAEEGGWESSVDFNVGGGNLVGLVNTEGTASPASYDTAGHADTVDMQLVGLESGYEAPKGPGALTVSPDGDRLSWISWNMTEDEGNLLSYQLTIVDTDGSNRREFTLPAGPARADGLVDHGDYIVVSSLPPGDSGPTAGALIDAATGGMLVLPIAGAAAASGQWTEPPRWAIPSQVTEDITEEIKALEPQWADGRDNFNYEKALADLLLAGDADSTDECSSTARTFPDVGPGDGPFYIELRQSCDDSVAGSWYQVTVFGPQPDGSLTGGATRRTLCWRGVTPDGICV